jgi:hypothetical protein
MELNGAFSNPFVTNKSLFTRVSDLHRRLVGKARVSPRVPRMAPPKASPVLATVTLVLTLAEEPMRAREVHAASEELAGRRFQWTSVKAALSAGATGDRPRFQRVRHGVYAIVNAK